MSWLSFEKSMEHKLNQFYLLNYCSILFASFGPHQEGKFPFCCPRSRLSTWQFVRWSDLQMPGPDSVVGYEESPNLWNTSMVSILQPPWINRVFNMYRTFKRGIQIVRNENKQRACLFSSKEPDVFAAPLIMAVKIGKFFLASSSSLPVSSSSLLRKDKVYKWHTAGRC